MHEHGGGGLSHELVLPFALALVLYVAAVVSNRKHRRRPWPAHRTVAWVGGVVAAAAAFLGPLAGAARHELPAHMTAHLLVGIVAPLLLVLAAPVTLALRTLPVVPARRLARLLRSAPVAIVAHPVTTAVASVGSLWLVYGTPAFGELLHAPLIHELVLVHFLIVGYLFTAAIVGIDPSHRRTSFRLRAIVLAAVLAAHAILAKLVYSVPHPGVPVAEAEAAGLIMYYGGDLVALAIIAILCAQWFRATRSLGWTGGGAKQMPPSPVPPRPLS
ncbi:cytochrome c oxidase assembly protein [Agromyces sp. Marseille-P2726]|uniref:cytochrome c oxidase assembly protein n=1 Tax=Agromyces sp. Marseille-P2726 TaxID=2709132 RepID=UPI00156E361B|nr:cytochrome c oxidase assembly protein [Agromyces sp. Marseille-P2726]